jgi:diguanylate cyclase (GGDEF)-like protein
VREGCFVAGSLLAIAVVALLDYRTGPYLSFGVFYVLPVAACAWRGGFAHGSLVALAGAAAWHAVDLAEAPELPPVAAVWNGVVRYCTLTLVCCVVSRLHAGVQRERHLARTDSLTGAVNARTFYEAVNAAAHAAHRAGRPLTLAYLDLDNFKQLNDRFGHAAGDEALRHVCSAVREALGGAGLLARLGGDEFALLLPRVGPAKAAALLDRAHRAAGREMARRGWPVTLSVGAITFQRPADGVDLMIQWADALMYSAKRNGKARVEHVVIEAGQQPAAPWQGREKRAAVRVLCNRTARVYQEGQEEFATVRNLSAHGAGLHAERPLPLKALLVVEGFSPEAKTLLARVVRVEPDESGWFHGCSLLVSLSEEELGYWAAAGRAGIPLSAAADETGATAGQGTSPTRP